MKGRTQAIRLAVRVCLLTLAALSVLAAWAQVRSQAGAAPFVPAAFKASLVASSGGTTVTVGSLPTGVAVTATKAYVANSNSNSVSVVDLTASPPTATATIPVGRFPGAVALSPDGSTLYVTNSGANTVSIVSTTANVVIQTTTVGSRPTGIIWANNRVYVSNLLSASISILNPATGSVSGTIALPAGSNPTGLATNGAGTRLYVDDAHGNAVLVYDLTAPSPALLGSVGVGVKPAYLSVSGTVGYVANPGSNNVTVLNLAATPPTVLATATVGTADYGVAAVPSLNEVLVTNSGSNTLSVLNAATNTSVATYGLGHIPDAVAVTPDGSTAVVSNEGDNTLSVLHLNQPPTITAPGAQTVAGNQPSLANHLVFSTANSNLIAAADPDAGSNPVQVSLSVNHGTLTLSTTSGLAFSSGANGSAAMTFTGIVSNVNAALTGMSYTPASAYSGPDPLSITVNDQGSTGVGLAQSASAAVAITVTNPPPAVGAVNFSGAVGNTTFGVGTTPSQPSTHTSGSVLSNSSDADGDTLSAVAGTISTGAGGSVSMNSDGTFVYSPPAGFTGSDTFAFQVSDGTTTVTGTATVTVTNRVWYVNNAGSNGTGTSTSPFNNVGSAGTASADGDFIFVSGSATTYTGGITLKNSQTLVGQSFGLVVGGQTLVTAAGSNPKITNASGDAIGVGNNDTIEGITVTTPSGNAISGSPSTISIDSSVTITNPTGDGVHFTNGNGTLTINSPITTSAGGGHSVFVQGHAGTVNVGGALSDSGKGVDLVSNSATFTFSGGVQASTGSFNAFDASGGGTVSVSGSGNTLATTTGRALNFNGTTIGSGNLNFVSISAGTGGGSPSGPDRGISLLSTGTSGGLIVQGTGSPGGGGTIQHTTATGSATFGASNGAVYLSSTNNVQLNGMVISNNASNGIYGVSVDTFSISGSTLDANGTPNSAGDPQDSGIRMDGLSGTSSIVNTVVSHSSNHQAHITTNSGATLGLTVTGSTFGPRAANLNVNGLFVQNSGTTTLSASGNSFTGNFANGLDVRDDTGNMTVTVNNNTATNNTGVGILLEVAQTTSVGTYTFNVHDNTLTGQQGHALEVFSKGSVTMTGHIKSNTIGNPAVANSGSTAGDGIEVVATGSSTLTADVSNNTVSQIQNGYGINGSAQEGSATENLTLNTNTVNMIQATSKDGITVNSGVNAGDTATMCVNAVSNHSTAVGVPPGNGFPGFDSAGMSVIQNTPSSVFKIQGYTGSGTNDTAIQNLLIANNTLAGPAAGDQAVAQHNTGFTPFAGTCPTAP